MPMVVRMAIAELDAKMARMILSTALRERKSGPNFKKPKKPVIRQRPITETVFSIVDVDSQPFQASAA